MSAVVQPQTVIRDEATVFREFTDDELAFDLETTGLKPARGRVAVVCLKQRGKPPAVIHYPQGITKEMTRWLQGKILVGHNVTSFDIPFLMNTGYDPFESAGWRDTMIIEQLLRTSDRRDVSVNLASTLKRHLGKEIDKSIDHSGWSRPELTHEQVMYAATDVSYLLEVYERQVNQLGDLADAWDVEVGYAPVVASMTRVGMPLDDEYRRDMVERVTAEAEARTRELAAIFGRDVNPGSPKQMKDAFADVLGFPLANTKAETLEDLAQREPGEVGRAARLIVEARQFKKRGMYDEEWAEKYVTDGRVHSSWWVLGADTGRFTSSRPNLQQIPRNHRAMFATEPGSVLISIDYRAIEVLVGGVLMREHRIVDAYTSGTDLHSYVASLVFKKPPEEVTKNERTAAKAGSFTLLFAGGVPGLQTSARQGGLQLSRNEAEEIIDAYMDAFPAVAAFVARIRRQVQGRQVFPLRVPRGPRRVLVRRESDISASQVINTLVQGTAAAGLKHALIRIKEAGIGDMVRAVVHDEIVLECPRKEAEEVMRLARNAMELGIHDVIGVKAQTEGRYGRSWS